MATENQSIYSLRQFVLYFLKLGYSRLWGTVALVAYMYCDSVEKPIHHSNYGSNRITS
jgi:hypothetical protein